jgi:hypothetical protein
MARTRPQTGRYHAIKRVSEMMVKTAPGHHEWRAITFWDVRDMDRNAVLTSYRTYGEAQWEADHRNAGTWPPRDTYRRRIRLEV